MLSNYLKIAVRNLIKNPVYSFINIAGLSIGIASAILILLWVEDEMSFNHFHKNFDRLYQVNMNQEFQDGIRTQQAMPYLLKEAITNKSSHVKHVVITNWGEGNLLTVGDTRLDKVGLSASEDFLKIFSFDLIKGNPETALADPNSIVLTESTAKSLFGNKDPINQLVRIDNDRELKVSGLAKDVPAQSTIKFDYILPFAFYEATQSWIRNSKDSWQNHWFPMYVELQPNAVIADANQSIQNLIKENDKESTSAQLFLHPMNQWRLYSNFKNGKVSGGMIEYVQLFTIIAVFVLVIACINFMNLATARSESRAREVGIRKSVGSRRKELIFQFLGESILITLLAFLAALFMVELLLPAYNSLVDKTLFIDYSNGWLWLNAIAMVLVTGVVAGSYPAFYLSAFQPLKVLKGKIQAGRGASTPRKVLVTLQFGFSILLIVGTVVIYQQIQYVRDRDTGYDRENLMMVWTTHDIETNFNPSYPFNYRFADLEFEKKFSTINLISRLSFIFAALAIIITCLGLFGLAAFTAEQRTKEIGIRKVMGATVSGLVLLITKDFSRMVVIAFTISAPLAWWALNIFLERYPYRISIPWWVLPLAGFMALMLTLVIVSTQALRAATSNPANSLRSE